MRVDHPIPAALCRPQMVLLSGGLFVQLHREHAERLLLETTADTLPDLNGDGEVCGIADKPFLDVERADNRRFALVLGLREFHRVFRFFFLLKLNLF